MRIGAATLVDGVSFDVVDGETVGLIGPNGSGKTTTLRALLGAQPVVSGSMALDGRDVAELSVRDRARAVAAVLQEEPAVLPLSVWDDVALGRSVHRPSWQRMDDEDRAIVDLALRRTGTAALADRSVLDLSGGERQRVLIARALAQSTPNLVLDEPTNHLDVRFQYELMHLVARLTTTTLVVLHDLNLAARYCDRLVLLDRGRVVATGTPDEVLRPQVLEPVYGIAVTRVDADVPQLLFVPRDAALGTVAP